MKFFNPKHLNSIIVSKGYSLTKQGKSKDLSKKLNIK